MKAAIFGRLEKNRESFMLQKNGPFIDLLMNELRLKARRAVAPRQKRPYR
jgi:hypothetical protein